MLSAGLRRISAKGDPLETIKKIVRWEDFRADIESVITRILPLNAGRSRSCNNMSLLP
jgi:hypothetical protein